MTRTRVVLALLSVVILVILLQAQAFAQPYVPTVVSPAAVTTAPAAAPPAVPSAPAFPFTSGDLMLLSIGVGVLLTAAGLSGKYLLHKRG